MLLDLVLWSWIIVLAPLALGLAWRWIAGSVTGVATTYRVLRRSSTRPPRPLLARFHVFQENPKGESS